jgi:acetylornithine/succinyldiaminopimelate/putrescine aminotransferase
MVELYRLFLFQLMMNQKSNYHFKNSNFGPFTPGMVTIPYNDESALEETFKKIGDKCVGFLVEPIQGILIFDMKVRLVLSYRTK